MSGGASETARQLDLFDPPPALSAPETAPERRKGNFHPLRSAASR